MQTLPLPLPFNVEPFIDMDCLYDMSGSSILRREGGRESRRTKIIFFTALTWKNGPTMNDNSSMTVKPSYRTKVFAF